MLRMLFSSVLAIHGIIHLMGFAKEWNLGPVAQFSGKTLVPFSEGTLKFIGVLWLLASLLLIASTAAYYSKKEWFWILAAAGLILSQALIVLYWQDAKWGTPVNLIILAVVIFSVGSFRFKRLVTNETATLISASSSEKIIVTEQMVNALPPVVSTWLTKTEIIGTAAPRSVHIIQKGSMRTTAQGDWMPFDAEQYFTIDPPGFVWKANIHANKFIDIVGRDKYVSGKGNMLIKAASLLPMANSSGPEIDQGTLIRFMAEIIWFPHAAVSHYLTWEQTDSTTARVTMNYKGVTASGIFTFNKDGFPIGFEAERFREVEGKFSKEKWTVAITSYRYFNGLPLANKSDVTWKLKDGDFTWLKLEIITID